MADGIRKQLFDHLVASLSDVAIAKAGAEVVATPAIVIHPALDEYVTPTKMGGPEYVQVQIILELIVNRIDLEAGVSELERLFMETFAVVRVFVGSAGGGVPRWIGFGDIEQTEIGDSPALSGQYGIAVAWPLDQLGDTEI